MLVDIIGNNSSLKSRYRPEIDGLRAFAVIAVIINHFNKEILPNGYLGVDIFFVISGFVITSSLYQRPSKDFKDFISGFYERRVKRLVPALSIFILITSIAICLFNPEPSTSLKTGLTSMFGLSNLYLLKQSTDYFAQTTELNVFTHTWSLSVEEQFYILFPFLAWFSGFGRQTKNGTRNLFLIVAGLTITSLIGFLYLYPINQSAAYFFMPTRFWEMASGCLLFVGLQKRKSIEHYLEKIPPILVLAFIIGLMYLPKSLASTSTVALVFLTLILITSLKKRTRLYAFFTHHKVVYIGMISYSLYLWHWGIISISRWTIGIHWWSLPFQIVLMFGLAISSYKYLETPLRNRNWFGKRWKTIVMGGGVIFTLSFGLIALIYPLKGQIYAGKRPPYSTLESWFFDKEGNYIERCHVETRFSVPLMKECLLAKNRKDASVGYLIGDSHARNYLIAARKTLPSFDIKYMTMGYGCAFLPSSMISDSLDENVSCNKYSKSVASLIAKESRRGDIIFIGQALNGKNHDKRATQIYFDHIKVLAQKLKEKEIPVIIFDGTFPPRQTPMLCMKEFFRPFPNNFDCEKPIDTARSSYNKFDKLAQSLSNSSENIYYAPLRLGLCLEETCGQFTKNGTPIWYDNGHITEKSSGELADMLRQHLMQTSIGIFDKE